MKDRPAIIVFLVILACLVALGCLFIVLVMRTQLNLSTPAPTSTTPPDNTPTQSLPSPSSTSPSPKVSLTVSPNRLMEGAEALIEIKLTNPDEMDLEGHTLLIGYGTGSSLTNVTVIQTMQLTSDVGDLFETDILWQIDYIPDGREYAVVVSLLDPDFFVLDETSAAIEIVEPIMDVSISPEELTLNSEAVIHVEVVNPSDVDMNGYTLLLGYATRNDAEMFSIRDIIFSLPAGEVFEQDISWNERRVPQNGEYELRMVLLLPSGTVLTETNALFTLNAE